MKGKHRILDGDYIMAPNEFLVEDPCPRSLPEKFTAAHIPNTRASSSW